MRQHATIAVLGLGLAMPLTAEAQSGQYYRQPTWQVGVGAAVAVHLGQIDDGRRRVHGTARIYGESARDLIPEHADLALRPVGGTELTYRSGEQPQLEWTVRAGFGGFIIPAYGHAHFTYGRGSAELGLSWRPSDGEVQPLLGLEGRLVYLHAAYRLSPNQRQTLDVGLQTGVLLFDMNE